MTKEQLQKEAYELINSATTYDRPTAYVRIQKAFALIALANSMDKS